MASWLFAGGAAFARTGGTLPAEPAGIGVESRLGNDVPADIELVDETGQRVTTCRLFTQRPTVLALVYYGCPNLYSLVLQGLVGGLAPVTLASGKDFNVVIASIDPR